MALEERRTLKEVTILCGLNHINCMWADEIVKDGQVIHSSEHRGAYPLNENGEPDDTVVGLLGTTMEDLLGEVGAQSAADLYTLQQIHQGLELEFNTKVSELNERTGELEQAQNQIQTLTSQNQQLTQSYDQTNENLMGVIAEREQLQNTNQLLTTQLQQAQTEIQVLTEQLVALQNQQQVEEPVSE